MFSFVHAAIRNGTDHMEPERRKSTRHLVSENVYAALGPSYSVVGRIKDISIGGLAIKYITDEESAQNNLDVSIFNKEERFHLFKLPCKIMYDIRLDAPRKAQVTAGALVHRRCGVQFVRITPKHKKLLEDVLSEHTVDILNELPRDKPRGIIE